MKTRFGWDQTSWFGQFIDVAAGALGLALFGVAFLTLAFPRPDAAIASGGNTVPVLGADIGAVSATTDLPALTAGLKREVKDLPWPRALRRRAGDPSQSESLFFPVNGIAEAFALCAQLAKLPPACAPDIASSAELEQMDGAPLNETALSRLGIAPYNPPRVRSRVAATANSLRRS